MFHMFVKLLDLMKNQEQGKLPVIGIDHRYDLGYMQNLMLTDKQKCHIL